LQGRKASMRVAKKGGLPLGCSEGASVGWVEG
jgi:hypothetical protein